MAQATVYNPTTQERKVVTVGDPNAFAGGFSLETPTNNLNTITADKLSGGTEIKLNPAPIDNSSAGIVKGGQAMVDEIFKKNTADFQAQQAKEQAAEKNSTNSDAMMQRILDMTNAPTDPTVAGGSYETAWNSSGLDAKGQDITNAKSAQNSAQTELNMVDAQLKGISAEADAQKLALEGQARATGTTAGTATLLNRQQNEIDRQAAIKSLPLQAQALVANAKVLSAQGDVSNAQNAYNMASEKFNTLFKLKSDYETSVYNYKKDQQNLIYDYLTKKESEQLAQIQKEDDRAYNEKQTNNKTASDWATQAMQVSLPDVAAQIAKLDPSSPTFQQDLQTLQAQVVAKQNEKALTDDGWQYVKTPAERDSLIKQGYEMRQINGKIYARVKPLTEMETYEAKKKVDQKYKEPEKLDWGIIGQDEEGNSQYGFIDTANGLVKPVGGEGGATYTDGSGAVNNVAGWAANDESKVASMQNTANRIGQITEENINAKVAQFTPGVTAEMIKNASAKYGVSWESIMTQIVQESTGGVSPVALKNNNFGGLTASSTNMSYYGENFNGSLGTARPASEGGNYIKFATKQDGVNALADLQATYNSRIKPANNNKYQGVIDLVKSGQLSPKDALEKVEQKDRLGLSNELAKITLPTDTEADADAKQKMTDALNLKTDPGLNSAVGTSFITRGNKLNKWDKLTGNTQNFIGSVEKLVSSLSLDALIDAKAKGATFGALSDKEMLVLSQSATKIGRWAKVDGDGRVIGYDIDEKNFKTELDNISKIFQRAIKSQMFSNDSTSDPLGILNVNMANSTNPLGLD